MSYRDRSPQWVRRSYLVWRGLLGFFDLLGDDARVSATKLAAALVLAAMLYIAVKTLTVPGGVVTLVIAAFAVLFGRRVFLRYLGSRNGNGHTTEHPTPPPSPDGGIL